MTDVTYQALVPDAGAPVIDVMSSGPSGLLLGQGANGPVTLRLFRQAPTRLYLAVPEYLTWLIAFRSMCIGAHLSVIAADHRRWLVLADTVRACGGTIDLLRGTDNIPGQGRPYRPSLIIDETDAVGTGTQLGAWQSLVTIGNPASSKAIGELRAADVAMIAPLEGKAPEHLRRAYALSAGQLKSLTELESSEVVLAGVRRVMRVKVPPSPTEHRLLFGG